MCYRICLLCCICLFTSISTQTFAQAKWEVNLLRDINPQHPTSGVWKGISSTAKPLSVAIPLGLMATALIQKDKALAEKAYTIAGSVAIAAISTEILKQAANRPRPFTKYADIYPNEESDREHAFPSGHVSVVFAAAGSLALQYKKWYIAVPLYTWGTAVAYSRIYLGQHYPSDVIMGAAVGMGSAYLAQLLQKKIFRAKPKATQPNL